MAGRVQAIAPCSSRRRPGRARQARAAERAADLAPIVKPSPRRSTNVGDDWMRWPQRHAVEVGSVTPRLSGGPA
jgi:hypothetical protein